MIMEFVLWYLTFGCFFLAAVMYFATIKFGAILDMWGRPYTGVKLFKFCVILALFWPYLVYIAFTRSGR